MMRSGWAMATTRAMMSFNAHGVRSWLQGRPSFRPLLVEVGPLGFVDWPSALTYAFPDATVSTIFERVWLISRDET